MLDIDRTCRTLGVRFEEFMPPVASFVFPKLVRAYAYPTLKILSVNPDVLPASTEWVRLVVHELAHIVKQKARMSSQWDEWDAELTAWICLAGVGGYEDQDMAFRQYLLAWCWDGDTTRLESCRSDAVTILAAAGLAEPDAIAGVGIERVRQAWCGPSVQTLAPKALVVPIHLGA